MRISCYSLLFVVFLTACGGTFMTSTPAYSRFSANAVFKEFKDKGLRVDGVRDMPASDFGAETPAFKEAKGFHCGTTGGTTATLFTFDSPTTLSAMADYLKKKYGTKQRQVAHQNTLLVFWLPSKDDTIAYDVALLALR